MPEHLTGGRFAAPVRHGDVVERQALPPNSRALLRHFETVGFDLAPRYLGTSADGRRDRLSYVEGATGSPPLPAALRSDEALVSVARAIRAMHDATEGFVPVDDGWRHQEYAVPVVTDCIGHGDLAPWNLVFAGTEVTGIIDWDTARPSNRAWDLAYAAHQFVPFHPTGDLPLWGWPTPPDRSARLRLFCSAYGADVTPADLVDLAVLRLLGVAAEMAQQIRAGNRAYAVQAADDHPAGYRKAAAWILAERESLLG
ncbi:phosphotransferase [Kribbella sp. CA-247076]|uniref:phosphotransferase n=1 Tax=Kribbella sp. CA-247076 TaxID=3239941 RepID=UPI003D8D6DD2